MKVQEAIEYLSKKNPDEQIIIAWWDSEAFAPLYLTRVEWEDYSESAEDWMDWSRAHEALELHLITAKEIDLGYLTYYEKEE